MSLIQKHLQQAIQRLYAINDAINASNGDTTALQHQRELVAAMVYGLALAQSEVRDE